MDEEIKRWAETFEKQYDCLEVIEISDKETYEFESADTQPYMRLDLIMIDVVDE
jgi:hypothetical protein